jgi:hypothetical protein
MAFLVAAIGNHDSLWVVAFSHDITVPIFQPLKFPNAAHDIDCRGYFSVAALVPPPVRPSALDTHRTG